MFNYDSEKSHLQNGLCRADLGDGQEKSCLRKVTSRKLATPTAAVTVVTAALVLLAVLGGTQGQAQTWNVTGGGDWTNNANWTAGGFPNATNASAVLGTSITNTSLITLGQDITVGSLTFNDNNNYTLRSNTLIFNTGGGAALLLVTNSGGNGAHTISNAIQLSNNLVVSQGSTGLLTMSGAKSGAGGLTKEGTNRLALSGVASYTGATLINDGRIDYNTDGAIPTGSAVTIGDGVGAAASATLAIVGALIAPSNALAITIASDGLLLQGPTRLVRISSLSGTSPTGELRINNIGGVQGVQFIGDGASNNSTYSGRITMGAPGAPPPSANFNGGSRINKSGTATLTLDGSNSYTAPTFISGGALRAASSNALGAAGISNATYVFSAGALELAGNVSIAEPLFLDGQGDGAGALRSASGSNTVIGPLAIGWTGTGVTASNASLGAAANSTLVMASQITSTNAAIGLTTYGAGTVTFATNNTYTGATVVNSGTLLLAAASNAVAGSVEVQSNGTLTLATANQIADTSAVTNSGGTIDIGANTDTVASFNMSGGAINGTGTLTAATYGLTAGTVNANLGPGTLTKTGSGTATITAGRTVAATTSSVQGGQLAVNGTLDGVTSATNAGTIAGTGTVGSLNINGGGTLSPGNSPGAGTLTATNGASWSQGGTYDWEIFSLTDNPGTSWDLLDVTAGTLDLTGITAGGFTINLITLQGDNTPGALAGFDPTADYNDIWLIARAPTITGFNAANFNLVAGNFVGATGTFTISQLPIGGGEGLYLSYNGDIAVPEPGTWAMAALLVSGAAATIYRRRKAAKKVAAAD